MRSLRTPWERFAFHAGFCTGVLAMGALTAFVIVLRSLLDLAGWWPA